MTDPDIHTDASDPEMPRRLHNKPDSWIDLHPVENENPEEPFEGPPRYVVLERRAVWVGNGCAGCFPGCLTALMLGLVLIGTVILGMLWACVHALTGLFRLFRLR